MSARPNILLIVIDQFRGDLLGDGALARAASLPNLRALMTESVTFSEHYSVVVPCGPSRASLLTGQYAMNHRAVRNGTPLRHDTPNLASEARGAGYAPLLFGYTDTTQDPRVLAADDPRLATYEELMPGFDEVLRMRQESDDSAWRAHLAGKGNTLPPYPETYRPAGDRITDPALYAAEDSDTAFLTDRFLAHMDGAAPGWCAMLAYVRPHPPLVAPEPWNRLHAPADMPAPRTTLEAAGDRDWHPFLAPAQDKQPPGSMVTGFPDLEASPETTAALRAVYLGLASEVDHHIGRVVDWLKTSGRWDDTLLIVTSDHGEMLGDFGLWGKGTFHDAAFHVPLLIRDPARPAMHGRTVAQLTESVDVMPTILEAIGAAIPPSVNGRSLGPFLEDVSAEGRGAAFSEYDFGHPVKPTVWMKALGLPARDCNFAVLRTPRHRIVEFGAPLPPVLFDMEEDGEARNRACDPEAMPILLDLTRRMLRHRMVNPEGTFARTIVGQGGVRTGIL